MQPSDISKKFFQALSDGNADVVRDLCDRDFALHQNGGTPLDLESAIGLVQLINKATNNSFHFEKEIRHDIGDSGFLEEHVARATLPSGKDVALSVAVVGRLDVASGKILETKEYYDPTPSVEAGFEGQIRKAAAAAAGAE